jgi:aspartyl-tRNA(Asn)/glutamyl-tRNA(Gln) amidotransferase subunit C
MIDVAHLAALAQLSLTEDEAKELTRDLERIVAYVDELSKIDVTGVEPMRVLEEQNVRSDEPLASLPKEAALAGAPRADEGGFVVPPFVEP